MNRKTKIIISGGGSGGHIFPAVSIANAYIKKYPDTEILFIGAEGKMEMEKVPAAGYKIVGLPVVGMQRKLSLAMFSFVFKVIKSLRKAKRIIKDFNPDVVVGVGGYASGPALRAAASLKIPCLIQEQNSYAGVTNKLLAKKASKICVAYDNMERFFPKEKIIKTGNPVRADIKNIPHKSEEAYKFFGLNPNKPILFAVGGSLGARTINESIADGLKKLIEKDIQIIWQTGKTYFPKAKDIVANLNTPLVYMNDFIYRMDLAYSIADIIISRAGASTISELCIVGKPVIFVPSPNVAEDHQTKNAQALTTINAALMISDIDARDKLLDEAFSLLSDKEKQKELSENIKQLELPDAADIIADEVHKLAYGQ
ncbi:MAG TPA: undecaprenyldiphospho-muramoylpentapeptide beta-N-acetylglucosaminyltransferase [Bacteroidales bacterium]|nr:undecaprenyldiphospho-muramoylpentapeptide beta-N-acetylglucosaminyltransferase [Bacteroidales bacterium]